MLSNNASLRLLGARRWKALQRWNYALILLVFFHALAYQMLEKRFVLGVLGVLLMMVALGTIRVLGHRSSVGRW